MISSFFRHPVTVVLIVLLATVVGFSYAFLPKHFFSSPPTCVADPIFSALEDPNSTTYQNTVLDLLSTKKPEDFRYIFQTFLEEEAQTYVLIELRNEAHCFIGKFLVLELGHLAPMKPSNGVSYPKELLEVEWEIANSETGKQLIFLNMHRIID